MSRQMNDTTPRTFIAYASAVWLNLIAWLEQGFALNSLSLEQWIAIVVGSLTGIHLTLRIYAEIKNQFFKKGSNP